MFSLVLLATSNNFLNKVTFNTKSEAESELSNVLKFSPAIKVKCINTRGVGEGTSGMSWDIPDVGL